MTELFNFSHLNDHGTDAKIILNSGKIVYANLAFCGLLGFQNLEGVLGESIFTFIHPSFHNQAASKLLKVTDGETAPLFQQKMVGADGRIVEVEVIAAPFIHTGDILIQAVIRDLSILKKNEDLLRQFEKLSLIGELASGIVHEIRNPLTSIKGFLQLMKTYPKSEYIDIILQELKQIEEIANELLYFSKPEENSLTQQNIQDIIREAVTFSSVEAFKRNIKIEYMAAQEPYIGIIGNKTQLKQVLLNIIKNGYEAIKGNGILKVHINKDRHNVYIDISDNGSGIPKEKLNKIGQPFYTSKEQGTGLGLAVSFNIIKNHNGDIHVESEENLGTTFSITLPLAAVKALPLSY